jgi:hypothetical protein
MKFHYLDSVAIVDGFLAGETGAVIDEITELRRVHYGHRTDHFFKVRLCRDDSTHWVHEDYLDPAHRSDHAL